MLCHPQCEAVLRGAKQDMPKGPEALAASVRNAVQRVSPDAEACAAPVFGFGHWQPRVPCVAIPSAQKDTTSSSSGKGHARNSPVRPLPTRTSVALPLASVSRGRCGFTGRHTAGAAPFLLQW